MTETGFRVPSSSVDELKKIVQGYAHLGENVQLDALSRLLSIGKTVISPNHPFLVENSLVTSGRVKSATASCIRLGRAWEHKQVEDVKNQLREIIKASENLANLITTVRLKGGMTEDDLVSHILFAAGLPNNKNNRTGARTIIELTKEAELLELKDGKLQVAVESGEDSDSKGAKVNRPEGTVETVGVTSLSGEGNSDKQDGVIVHEVPKGHPAGPQVTINIELKIPATENPDIYENFFKAMKKHLWPSTEGKVDV